MQKTSDTKFADYKPHVAFFFPGQGAQTVGMAKVILWIAFCHGAFMHTSEKQGCFVTRVIWGLRLRFRSQSQGLALQDVVNEVSAAKELFQQASDILSYDLLKVCTDGE